MKKFLCFLFVITLFGCSQNPCRVENVREFAHRELCIKTLPQSKKFCKEASYSSIKHLITGKAVDTYLDAYTASVKHMCR